MMKNTVMGSVGISTDDSGKFRRGFSKWLGRLKQKVESFVPFGTFGTPIPGNAQIKLSKNCQESNTVVLEGDPVNRIIKDTKPGEFGVGNPLRKSYIYFKDNGDVEQKTGNTTLTLHSNGTISLVGVDNVELIEIIDNWMGVMINAKVITGIGLQPFDPVTLASMQAVRIDLQKLKV